MGKTFRESVIVNDDIIVLYHGTTLSKARRIVCDGFRGGFLTSSSEYAWIYSLAGNGVVVRAMLPRSMVKKVADDVYDEWVLGRGVQLPVPSHYFKIVETEGDMKK